MSLDSNLDAGLGLGALGDPYLAQLIGNNIGSNPASSRGASGQSGYAGGYSGAISGGGGYSGMPSGISGPSVIPSTGGAPTARPQAGGNGGTGALGTALGAYGLANRLSQGALGNALPSGANAAIGDLGNALGIYGGIKQGGVAGDTSAAINAAQLGSRLGMLPSSLGQYAGYAAIPLSIYNEVNNWQSGATGQDALGGAQSGAAIGTAIMPGIGTAIGAVGGALAGALSSVFGPGRVDPENANFNQYTKAYDTAPASQQAQVAAGVQNPYLPLAGYFDLREGQLKGQNPIYDAYGRKGEGKFTNDLISKVQQGQQSGIKDPTQMWDQVVHPWINSFGTWQDVNKDSLTSLMQNMTGQIMGGTYQQNFKAIGGDSPFAGPASGSATPAPTQHPSYMGGRGMGTRQFNGGGSVLDHIRPSFAKAQRFDDGGGVSTYFGTGSSTPSYDSSLPTVTVTAPPQDTGTSTYFGDSTPFNPGTTVYQSPLTSGTGQPSGGAAGGILSGILSHIPGIGSSLAGLSSGQQLGLLGGLANLIGSIGGGNNTGGVDMTANYHPSPPPMFQGSGPPPNGTAGPYGTFNTTPRQRLTPNVDYAHYGEGPAQQFFSPLAGHAQGGAMHGHQSPMAAGVQYISPTQGGPHHVKGAGNGTSDSIPSLLSDSEYVIDAPSVSLLGNGSNDAGARKLDLMRENLRKHAAKPMAKGKQFMKAKDPMAYMKGSGN